MRSKQIALADGNRILLQPRHLGSLKFSQRMSYRPDRERNAFFSSENLQLVLTQFHESHKVMSVIGFGYLDVGSPEIRSNGKETLSRLRIIPLASLQAPRYCVGSGALILSSCQILVYTVGVGSEPC